MTMFAGVITAMVTPFDEDGAVDLGACRAVARHLLENGSDGLVLGRDDRRVADPRRQREAGDPRCRTRRARARRAADRRRRLQRHQALGRADAGGDGRRRRRRLDRHPLLQPPEPAGVRAHFEACAEATELPLIIYNIPSRCVVNIPPDDLAALATIDNVVAVKQANDAELGPIEGLDLLAGNDNVLLRCLEGGGSRRNPRRLPHRSAPRMREICDAVAGRGYRRRPCDRRRAAAALRGARRDHATRSRSRPRWRCSASARSGCGLPMVPASDEQRATIRAALEPARTAGRRVSEIRRCGSCRSAGSARSART